MRVRAGFVLFACLLIQLCFGLEDAHIAARAAAALPSPAVAAASQYFEGIDGPWSTFELRVGTPSQNVRVLIGTSSTSTLVVLPLGCQSGPSNCSDARGGIFNTTASSTWSNIGNYALGFENNLGLTDAGDFGHDTVGLGYQGGGGPTVNHSVIAGVAGTDFYLGLMGLKPEPTNFTTLNDPQPSLMTLLKNQSDIPSLSYSYTAGAPYRLNKALGSLILGGYDTSRFQDTNSSYQFNSDQSRDLTLGLAAVTTNITGSEMSLLPSGSISIFIDSSVAGIYLPVDACQAFETAFNLTYNSTAGLYLVNSTLHQELVSKNPSVTFTINTAITGGAGFNITLPYAAFSLTAEYPLVETSSLYFPLQRAANNTQYTLGRTFLQEAYLIVDYERGNFSVHPNIWNASAVSNIVTIPPVTSSIPSTTSAPSLIPKPASGGIGGGAIAGIVIGVLFGVVVVAVVLFWCVVIVPRRKKQQQQQPDTGGPTEPKPKELDAVAKLVPEIDGTWNGVQEVEGSATNLGELDACAVTTPAYSEMRSRPPELGGAIIHEMLGSEVPEMPTTEMAQTSNNVDEPSKSIAETSGNPEVVTYLHLSPARLVLLSPVQGGLFETLNTALELGANFWNVYGTPEYNSCHLLNVYFTKYPRYADKVVLSIQGGIIPGQFQPDGSEKKICCSLDECLRILNGTKSSNIFECARQDPTTTIEQTVTILAQPVKEGKIGGMGLSKVDAESIRRAYVFMTRLKYIQFGDLQRRKSLTD